MIIMYIFISLVVHWQGFLIGLYLSGENIFLSVSYVSNFYVKPCQSTE